MRALSAKIGLLATSLILSLLPCYAVNEIPAEMKQVMDQDKYEHAFWSVYAKDLTTGKVLYDLNSDKLFSPASTTKLFTVAALFNAYGDDYRFKTPVYATKPIQNGKLDGDLVLVAQGDLTMGGRQSNPDQISYTKMDHIIANSVPGVILTKQDPLQAINSFAKQAYNKGLREINGDIIIDESLFDKTEKRGFEITPMMINENLIDVVVDATKAGEKANVNWRPQVPGYEVINEVKTVDANGKLNLEMTTDETTRKMTIKGTIPVGQSNIVRTFPITDPGYFARAALIQALEKIGVKVNITQKTEKTANTFQPNPDLLVAEWVSPPLSEYGKLILKVSHNLGADLIPLLLAAQKGQKTFDEGMVLFGEFVENVAKISPDQFVFIDGAGGNENRLTPQAEIALLDFMYKKQGSKFQNYFDALPILGVDGSLEDFGKGTPGVNKVRAKPGTGVAYNISTGKFFLITQAFAGYIEGKNGHLFAYEVVINNGKLPTVDDIFGIFEDEAKLSNFIYEHTNDQF